MSQKKKKNAGNVTPKWGNKPRKLKMYDPVNQGFNIGESYRWQLCSSRPILDWSTRSVGMKKGVWEGEEEKQKRKLKSDVYFWQRIYG